MNKDAQHQAVVLVRYEVHERDKMGTLSKPVKTGKKIMTFVGKNYDECMEKLGEFLNENGENNDEN